MIIYNLKKFIRNISHKSTLIKKIYLYANKIKVKRLKNLSNEDYAKKNYRENTGLILDLDNPALFNEKLWWLKINNRDPLLTQCSDKLKVRDYVKGKGLGHILNELYFVYEDAKDIDFDKLPDRAFIKTNHGSGTSAVWERERPFDKDKFIKKFNKSLQSNYYYQSREWNYKDIEPRILVERIIEDKDDKELVDYKIMCFDGKVKLVFVELEIINNDGSQNPYSTRNVYDRDFNYIDMQVRSKNFDQSLVTRPVNFDKMIKYAEILAEPFVHCRVDLYNIDGEIIFGEMTFYNGGATEKITPYEWNKIMGDWINLDSEKIVFK